MYTYLLINIFIFLLPFALSFEGRIKFVRKWIYLFPAIVISGCFCLLWNHYFTVWNIWSFNAEHVCGIYIFQLPLEQLLFFITCPFASIFLYECINYYYPGPGIGYKLAASISWTLVLLLILTVYLNSERVYTALSAVFALTLLMQHLLVFRQKYLGRFYRTFLACLLPFLAVDALLVNKVVLFDARHISGVGLFNIPMEDAVYFFFMLLLNLTIYEYAKGKRKFSDVKTAENAKAEEAEVSGEIPPK